MKVRVKNWGDYYSTYDKWFTENNCEEYLPQYKQEDRLIAHVSGFGDKYYAYDKNGRLIDTHNVPYEVIKIGNHGRMTDKVIYLIQEPITNKVYLIEKRATEEIRG